MGNPAIARIAPIARQGDPELGDLRFRSLIGANEWALLPIAVRARFSKRFDAGQSVSYSGTITTCRMSRAGWLLAQVCRVIGAPLPLHRGGGQAAVVTVTEHVPSGGQTWTRIYARKGGFPQVIHSAKMFSGPSGLEEYIGRGIGITLRVRGSEAGIDFHGESYFLKLGNRRIDLPRWLSPGALRIEHHDLGQGQFRFVLDLRHRWFGELIHQVGIFADQPVINPAP